MARKLNRSSVNVVHLKTGSSKPALRRSSNPMDWLYDNPLGSFPDFTFGILKQSYQGFPNTPSEFALHKLRPIGGKDHGTSMDPDTFTAYRYGCVLPDDAPDVLDEAVPLMKAFDLARCDHQPATLIYATLSFPDTRRLHHAWEESRAFAYENLARKRQLPVLLIEHRPGDAGSNNPVHIHLLISARRMDGTGFRGFADDLICDEGQRVLYDEWADFRSRWATR
ncbi:hypothetical protein [Sphingomonas edaphi]|uniref:MobA/MobL protein domain-containing protein n=1 Tax=Sphingomonas edaphi TaxID=2315689 RepID=A0A418PYD7_9SPHN|nr:hypothetical protein [Sphingomonas edaphi]RIX27008.1 hypothetical protein D3M59_10655 [Sphingomonas edaphi]